MDDRHGNFYASTADLISKTNINDMVGSANKFAAKLPTQDFIGIVIFLALLPIGFLYAVNFPIAFWCELYSRDWLFRVVPLLFLGLNVYFNAFMVVRSGPNSSEVLPRVVKQGHRYCHECQLNAPPRSFHCPVCNFCVFRRDHHCSFTGCCIGHFNQRFYVAAIVNLWPIALVCCNWNWHALLLAFSPLHPSDLLCWVFPHVALALRFISLYQFLMIMAFALSLITLLFVSYLIGAQLFCFLRGQTRVEYLMDIHAFHLSFMENVRQALGSRWPLIFVSPLVPSPLDSDGTSFRTRDRESIGKTAKYF